MRTKYSTILATLSISIISAHAGMVDFSVANTFNIESNYTESGIVFTTTDPEHAIFAESIDPYILGVTDTSEGWLGFAADVEFTMVAESAGTFDLYSMDIGASTIGAGTVGFTIIGNSTTTSFTNTYESVTDIQTVVLNWSDLSSATFFSTGSDGGVDKIATSAIPEPATLGLVGLFAGGLFFIRRIFMI